MNPLISALESRFPVLEPELRALYEDLHRAWQRLRRALAGGRDHLRGPHRQPGGARGRDGGARLQPADGGGRDRRDPADDPRRQTDRTPRTGRLQRMKERLLAVVALVALAPSALAQSQAANAPAPVPPGMQAEFEACLAGLRDDVAAKGISAATFNANTSGLAPDPGVLELLNRQPEFSTPIWDYMAGLVDEQRVADGRAMLLEHAVVLARVQQRYGVDPATVVAVWGVESDYGRNFGTRPLLVSLATLSCFDRRQA